MMESNFTDGHSRERVSSILGLFLSGEVRASHGAMSRHGSLLATGCNSSCWLRLVGYRTCITSGRSRSIEFSSTNDRHFGSRYVNPHFGDERGEREAKPERDAEKLLWRKGAGCEERADDRAGCGDAQTNAEGAQHPFAV